MSDFRAGTGTPVVLLHGASASWTVWQPALEALTSQHEVFAVTLTGHRGGPPLQTDPGQVRISTFVDGMEHRLDQLGLETAHLVGNSLGGRVSLELLRRGRARSVTAFSPAAAWSDPDGERVNRLVRRSLCYARIPGPRWLASRSGRARRAMNLMLMERGDRLPASYVESMYADLKETRRWLAHRGRNTLAEGSMAAIDIGSTPVCVAWGSTDRLTPFRAHGAPLRQLLPGAEFIRLPGCGHVPMWDYPHLVVETILRTASRAERR